MRATGCSIERIQTKAVPQPPLVRPVAPEGQTSWRDALTSAIEWGQTISSRSFSAPWKPWEVRRVHGDN